jgi:hypothetical protein
VSIGLATKGILSRRTSLGIATAGLESPFRVWSAALAEGIGITEATETDITKGDRVQERLVGVMTYSDRLKGTISR